MRIRAPGRVNLIGEHTDYSGGLVLPMAINLETTIDGVGGGHVVRLTSARETEPAVLPLDVDDPKTVEPAWARYVAGVIAELRPRRGFEGTVRTTIPVGTGLSSSSALTVAVAVALGDGAVPLDRVALAERCRRAEARSSGVPGGVMDQVASLCGMEGHALLVDCSTLDIAPVAIPAEMDVVVVDSGESRRLASSGYADRRRSVDLAVGVLGDLRSASLDDVDAIEDPTTRRRARHVVTENERVRAFVGALERVDLRLAGELMAASHASLRDDFEVTTPALDALAARLRALPGVHGARMTGGGFGGCVVALCERGALDEGWVVRASEGASVTSD